MGMAWRGLVLLVAAAALPLPASSQDAETQERERLQGALSSLERMGIIQGRPDLERMAQFTPQSSQDKNLPVSQTATSESPKVIYERQELAANPKASHLDSEYNSPDRVVPTGEAPSWTNEPPWWWLAPPWWIATPPLWSNAARSADPNGPWTGDTVPASVDVSLMQLAERVDLSFLELTERIHALPTGASYADETTPS